MATTYKQELDRSLPLYERFGGRFLTDEEADALFENVRTGEFEFVAMNLDHMLEDLRQREVYPAMSHADLVPLLTAARDAQSIAEKLDALGRRIDARAWHLWNETKDEERALRSESDA